jgi:hypothetical protein
VNYYWFWDKKKAQLPEPLKTNRTQEGIRRGEMRYVI